MSDQNTEQTSRELTESAIIPAVNKGFIKEAKEIEAAKYVLNEELIYGFENHDITFVLEREPQKIFNKGYHNDTLAYNDPDFNFEVDDVTFTNSNGDGVNMKESHSLYERYDLKEPMTGKIIRINQMTYNSAYFPFNSMAAGTLETQNKESFKLSKIFSIQKGIAHLIRKLKVLQKKNKYR